MIFSLPSQFLTVYNEFPPYCSAIFLLLSSENSCYPPNGVLGMIQYVSLLYFYLLHEWFLCLLYIFSLPCLLVMIVIVRSLITVFNVSIYCDFIITTATWFAVYYHHCDWLALISDLSIDTTIFIIGKRYCC